MKLFIKVLWEVLKTIVSLFLLIALSTVVAFLFFQLPEIVHEVIAVGFIILGAIAIVFIAYIEAKKKLGI